jgi:two-component system LytT family response regulator
LRGQGKYIQHETLNALETQLAPEKFLRVSRSAIVNLDRVKELQPMFKGEHVIVLQSSKRLTITCGLLREVELALKLPGGREFENWLLEVDHCFENGWGGSVD